MRNTLARVMLSSTAVLCGATRSRPEPLVSILPSLSHSAYSQPVDMDVNHERGSGGTRDILNAGASAMLNASDDGEEEERRSPEDPQLRAENITVTPLRQPASSALSEQR